MKRYLMVSEGNAHCYLCGDPEKKRPLFCPACQYAYWGQDYISCNPDNTHFTGLSEKQAREDVRYLDAVNSADSY